MYLNNTFAWIKEWDGSMELVRVRTIRLEVGDWIKNRCQDVVEIVYKDGVTHQIPENYFEQKMFVGFARNSDLNPNYH